MENLMKTFESQEFGKVRVVEISGETWMVGKDIAKALGYKETANMRKMLDADDYKEIDPQSSEFTGFVQNGSILEPNKSIRRMLLINESGMYQAVFGSTKANARKFKHWITSEVLPSIRKHGVYMTSEKIEEVLMNPEFIIKLATELKEEKQKVAQLQPKADFYDTVANSESLLSMADVAKVLDKGIGRNRLFKLLRDKGILQSNNVPYQRFVDAGYFKVVESSYMAGDNAIVSTVTYVKQKGVDYIRKLLEVPSES